LSGVVAGLAFHRKVRLSLDRVKALLFACKVSMGVQHKDTAASPATMRSGQVDGSARRLDLTAAIRGGMFWNVLSFFMSQGASFVIFLIVASRLPPEVFGIVALASILSDFVATDGRYACMDAIMQCGRYDKRSLNSAFLAFLALAVVFAVAMFAAAGPVGAIYGEPLVATFMPLFGVMILPVPWLSVMDALISRDLAFRQLTKRSIYGTLAGGAAGIVLAFSPWLIWALAAQRIVTLVATLFFEYRYTRWFPGLAFNWAMVRDFAGRFLPLWVISAFGQIAPRFLLVFFGLRFDGFTVGLLRAANRIVESVQGPIINPIMGLWFPLMAKVRGNLEGERQVYRDLTRNVVLLAFPAFAGLILVADDVVSVFLPDRYSGVAPLMRAVALATMAAPIAWFSGVAMAALGMNRASLIYTGAGAIGCVGALLLAPQIDAPWLYLSTSIPTPLITAVGVAVVNRRLKQSNLQYYAGLVPPVLATIVMVLGVWGLQQLLVGFADILRLGLCGVVGAVIYLGWLFVFHRSWLAERIKLLTGRDLSAKRRSQAPVELGGAPASNAAEA
jgi:O-antigen/teichoic acid export membrane protein